MNEALSLETLVARYPKIEFTSWDRIMISFAEMHELQPPESCAPPKAGHEAAYSAAVFLFQR